MVNTFNMTLDISYVKITNIIVMYLLITSVILNHTTDFCPQSIQEILGRGKKAVWGLRAQGAADR